MKRHTKIYIDSLGYHLSDYMPSEISGKKGVDIHHIISRGKGGDDRIENLMLLTREEHIFYGDKKQYMTFLLKKHKEFLDINGVKYSKKYINELIEFYN